MSKYVVVDREWLVAQLNEEGDGEHYISFISENHPDIVSPLPASAQFAGEMESVLMRILASESSENPMLELGRGLHEALMILAKIKARKASHE